MKDYKFISEIKEFAMFLAGGVFAKLHKEFMNPSQVIFPTDHWTNIVHHSFHFCIGLLLQIILCIWLLRIIVVAVKTLSTERKKEE